MDVDGCCWCMDVYGINGIMKCLRYLQHKSNTSPCLAYLVQPTDTDFELGDPFLQSKYLGENPYYWWLKLQTRPWRTPWHHKSLSDKQTELSKSNEIPEKDIRIASNCSNTTIFNRPTAGSARVRISKGGWNASPVGKWFLLASCLRRLLAEAWCC